MTGLFFGSFNPIHTGHLIVAEFMRQEANLSEVWFVVSPQNPFKPENTLLEEQARLKMVQLAIKGNRHFSACDVEFNLPRPSYSIHTLQMLRKKFPRRKFALIMGSDNLQDFKDWKNYREIIEHYRLFVYNREGTQKKPAMEHANLTCFESPYLHISSTHIRNLLRQQRSVRYLVPEKVEAYIHKHHCYQS